MQLPEPEEHGKSVFSLFWARNTAVSPFVPNTERAATNYFGLQFEFNTNGDEGSSHLRAGKGLEIL